MLFITCQHVELTINNYFIRFKVSLATYSSYSDNIIIPSYFELKAAIISLQQYYVLYEKGQTHVDRRYIYLKPSMQL